MLIMFAIGLFNLVLGFAIALLWDGPAGNRSLAFPGMGWLAGHGGTRFRLRRKASTEGGITLPAGEPKDHPSAALTKELNGVRTAECEARKNSALGTGSPPDPAAAKRPDAMHGNLLLDQAGFEALTKDWLVRDAERLRMVSGVLVEADSWGASENPGLDREAFLEAFQRLLVILVRKDRGFDRVARLDGNVFLLFLGDTALRNAMNAAERIRQTFAAAKFNVGERQISITASCAVTEWRVAEFVPQWISRLRQVLHDAKRAGGNCCHLEDESGSRPLAASVYNVPTHEINVAESH